MAIAEIPNKLYFRIGEVSDLVGVKPYVLRYWETEFGDIKPTKSKSGQRLYKRRDVEFLMRVKDLLYAQGFTINGARQKLKDICKDIKDVVEAEGSIPQEVRAAEVSDREIAISKKDLGKANKKILLKIKGELQKCLEELQG